MLEVRRPDKTIVSGVEYQVEEMERKGSEIKENLQGKMEKLKHTPRVRKNKIHLKDGVDMSAVSTTLSSEERVIDHTSGEEHHSLVKNLSNKRDNANF
jgi:hypothetical protein